MSDIHFMGGIHGVGKGTICNKVCEQTKLVHLIASNLLKWSEISATNNKNVENIPNTQDRLIAGLNNATKDNETYLLDGHFCLFNAIGIVEKVPLETFVRIAPKLIIVATEKVELIKQRLEKRDNKKYNFDILDDMQNKEKEHAEEIANYLNIPFIALTSGNFQPLINKLK
jgi:adenylate kinase